VLLLVFWISGNFPEIAWRAVHSRQAVHVVSAISGFLGRNRLAVHNRPPGDACDFTNFWNFSMNCLAVMINRQATRVSISDFGIFWVQGEYDWIKS